MLNCPIINPDVMINSDVTGSSGSSSSSGSDATGACSSSGHATTASSSPASASSNHHRHRHNSQRHKFSQSPPTSHPTATDASPSSMPLPPRSSITTPPFQHDARYIIDVTPPSMSSTSSSDDGSPSPITIDRDRPYSFYNENFTYVD